MKYLSLVFIALMGWVNAQNQRFTYEYKFKKFAKEDSLRTELMALDVTEKGSQFYSWDKKVSDSIMKAVFEKQYKNGGKIDFGKIKKRGSVAYKVFKNYPDFKVSFIDNFGGYSYKVKDPREINWQMTSETQKIGEWNCQKATTEFAGRKWTVWFTPEIPITDGPYKFRGLPGLIVKANCEDNSHSYLLVGVKKLPKKVKEKKQGSGVFLSLNREKKPIEVNLKKYAKQRAKYEADPNAEFRRMLSGSGAKVVIKATKNGKEMSGKDILRELDKKKKRKRNPIEIDLLH